MYWKVVVTLPDGSKDVYPLATFKYVQEPGNVAGVVGVSVLEKNYESHYYGPGTWESATRTN